MPVAKLYDESSGQWVPIQGGAPKGYLIDAQSIKGNGTGAFASFASGATIAARVSGANVPLSIIYTPPVDVWWEITVNIGYFEKTDANYHNAFAQLTLSPGDLVAQQDTESVNSTIYQTATQHSTVDNLVLRSLAATYKLAANTTYTATVIGTFSGGTWRYFPGYNAMFGKVWTR